MKKWGSNSGSGTCPLGIKAKAVLEFLEVKGVVNCFRVAILGSQSVQHGKVQTVDEPVGVAVIGPLVEVAPDNRLGTRSIVRTLDKGGR